MNIAVCIKRVPETSEAAVNIDSSEKKIIEDQLVFDINEADNYALEEALILKEKFEGEITLFTVGPKEADEVIKMGLAKGATKGVRITPEDLSMLDPFSTAKLLASQIKDGGYDLILTGCISSDMGNSQIGVTIAELLGIPHATLVIGMEIEDKTAKVKSLDKRKRTYMFTWAQNRTDIHPNFWKNVTAYKNEKGAALHVIAGRYNNPTTIWEQPKHEFWCSEVRPYLDANRHNVHKYLQVLSDIKTQPTASMPLTGLNSITDLESCIIGHPRQHLKSLPVLDGYPNKLLLSTGACTVPNYTDSKAGKKGEFHHVLGFIIVELDGEHFHIRQVSADKDGNFYDLFHKVQDGEVKINDDGCEFAVLGDLHLGEEDEAAHKATFSLLDKMKPKYTFLHDIFDGASVNHHEETNPFKLLERERNGTNSLKGELSYMIEWMKSKLQYNLVVVFAKFPISIELKGNVFSVKNLLGEKVPRVIKIPTDVKVEIKGNKDIIVTGIDKERVGQVAASIEQSTRVLNMDRRVVQDGIFITKKPHKTYV